MKEEEEVEEEEEKQRKEGKVKEGEEGVKGREKRWLTDAVEDNTNVSNVRMNYMYMYIRTEMNTEVDREKVRETHLAVSGHCRKSSRSSRGKEASSTVPSSLTVAYWVPPTLTSPCALMESEGMRVRER